MKVAKLVYASFVTRVVVDANATEEQILDSARKQFAFKVENELSENIEEIVNDVECPYDKVFDEF
jgi:hypothetical protein